MQACFVLIAKPEWFGPDKISQQLSGEKADAGTNRL
tara:strand:- start:17291 stop:17398 length:108 start_codon:yes stop_codon:yes gene_type:complete